LGAPLADIPERLWSLAEGEGSVDDRGELAGFDELLGLPRFDGQGWWLSGFLLEDLLFGGLELVGGPIPRALCNRVPLYQAMYSTVAWRAAARVGQGCWSRHSPFRDAKNDSASALSQHCPVRPLDKVTVRSAASVA
jgi:hypothetical protein